MIPTAALGRAPRACLPVRTQRVGRGAAQGMLPLLGCALSPCRSPLVTAADPAQPLSRFADWMRHVQLPQGGGEQLFRRGLLQNHERLKQRRYNTGTQPCLLG